MQASRYFRRMFQKLGCQNSIPDALDVSDTRHPFRAKQMRNQIAPKLLYFYPKLFRRRACLHFYQGCFYACAVFLFSSFCKIVPKSCCRGHRGSFVRERVLIPPPVKGCLESLATSVVPPPHIMETNRYRVAVFSRCCAPSCLVCFAACRRKLHGEDDHSQKHRNYLQHLGFGRAAGIPQHASFGENKWGGSRLSLLRFVLFVAQRRGVDRGAH